MKRLLPAILAVSAASGRVTRRGGGCGGDHGGQAAGCPALAVGAVRPAGSWGTAIEVPGLAALNKGGLAEVTSVSCGSAGNCAAGGYYRDRHRHCQGFVAVERHGRWGTAIEVPGLGALNKGGVAEVNSVSCGSAGNCAAGGDYTDRHGHQQGFVAVERHGRWGRAVEVPAPGAPVISVSCPSAGNCAPGLPTGPRCPWPACGTAAGARRSRCPAWRP